MTMPPQSSVAKLRRSERVKLQQSYDEDALPITTQVLSRFECLPTEIKLIVFSHVLSVDPFEWWPSTHPVGNGLLRVNKAINKLVSEVYYKQSIFCVQTLPDLRRFCKLDSVSLYRSLVQHFAFPSPSKTSIKINKPTIGKLKLFRNLKTLTFQANPKSTPYGDKVFTNLPNGGADIAERNGHKALHLLSTELPDLNVFFHHTHKEHIQESMNPRKFSSRWHLWPHGISKSELMKVIDRKFDRTWQVMRDQKSLDTPRYRLKVYKVRVWQTEDEILVSIGFEHKPLLNPEHQKIAKAEAAKAKAKLKTKAKAKAEAEAESEDGLEDESEEDLEDESV